MPVHAVIRIVVFLVLAVALASGRPGAVVAGFALVLLAHPLTAARFRPARTVIARLKWLVLALAVFYLWGTPGVYLWPEWGVWSPTREGLEEGALRLGALITVALGASLLMQKTPLPELIAALAWLVRPLEPLGLDPDRLAVRLLLVVEWATAARERGRDESAAEHTEEATPPVRPAPPAEQGGGRLRRRAELAVNHLRATLDWAEAQPPRTLILPALHRPPSHQWLWPLALAALLWWAASGDFQKP